MGKPLNVCPLNVHHAIDVREGDKRGEKGGVEEGEGEGGYDESGDDGSGDDGSGDDRGKCEGG